MSPMTRLRAGLRTFFLALLKICVRIALLFLAVPALVLILCLPFLLYSKVAQIGWAERFPPPGRMVDVGTHKMHLDCRGQGSPTIVLEAGGAGWSANWNAVRTLLPDTLRVCAYDRAGVGWSEAAPGPRDERAIAAELALLLENAEEEAPYILVGHSFGGTIALAFIEEHLDDVAGFVAVETPTYAFMRWRLQQGFFMNGTMRRELAPITSLIPTAFQILFPPDMSKTPYSKFSDYEKSAIQDAGFRTRMILGMTSEAPEVERELRVSDFGALPMVVIQAAASEFSSLEWDASQQALLRLSSNSRLAMADSSHGVTSQAPAAIVDAIYEILGKLDSRQARQVLQ